jgi:hypothetical protein
MMMPSNACSSILKNGRLTIEVDDIQYKITLKIEPFEGVTIVLKSFISSKTMKIIKFLQIFQFSFFSSFFLRSPSTGVQDFCSSSISFFGPRFPNEFAAKRSPSSNLIKNKKCQMNYTHLTQENNWLLILGSAG